MSHTGQNEVDIIEREFDNGNQNYQFSWAFDDNDIDNAVALLATDDSNDESQLIMTQEELMQFIQDAMMFLQCRKK